MVLVPVTVTNHKGQLVDGLQRNNFSVFDDQLPQPILSFSNDDLPCSVGLVLDVSGSMYATLGGFKEVVHAFLGASNPEDEAFLLTVSSRPSPAIGFTTDFGDIERDVQSTHAGGSTALIDTVYLGLHAMREARRPRRAILVLSDGMDNHSRYSKSELMQVAVEADVQIFTLIIDTPQAGKKPIELTEERQGQAFLEDLSERTGGIHFRVRNASEARNAAAKVGSVLRNQYLIGYQPPVRQPSGKWHRIRIKADVPKTSVYARNGYYAQ